MKLEDILAESMFNEMTPETKDKLVYEYIKKNINIDSYKIRNVLDDMIVAECKNAMKARHNEIENAVDTTLTEVLDNKNIITSWLTKEKIKTAARYLLSNL